MSWLTGDEDDESSVDEEDDKASIASGRKQSSEGHSDSSLSHKGGFRKD